MKTLLLCFATLFCIEAGANITVPAIIGSNMVLQRNSAVKLWGWGGSTEKIIVTTSWNNATDSTRVDGNAKWEITLKTPAAGGPYTITLKGRNTIVLQNILIGEVWVCSGQSNMDMAYGWGLPQMKEDFPTAKNDAIRFYTVTKNTSATPQDDCKGDWQLCDSNSVKGFSAVAYYFARKLNAELHIPVAVINSSWGGTPAEVWTPTEVVANNAVLQKAAQKLSKAPGWPIAPGYAYNAMIAPISKLSIAGAIWYQGESNTGTAATYQPLFTAMIEAWRKQWGQDFPFYFVQLAPYKYGNNNIAALLREAQTQTLALPKTGMVVTTDLADDTLNIHPKKKREVGYRLAALALADTYNQPVTEAKSPAYKSMAVDGSKAVITVSGATALQIKDKVAAGFFVAGDDKVFYPADVRAKGTQLTVQSKLVPRPVAVRYAFSNTAVGNVFNAEGLPLAPFRTDDWAVDTSAVK